MKIKKFKTEQEDFWAGSFGDTYIDRNQGHELLASNIEFFTRALKTAVKFGNCIEFGSNIGMNLKALKILYPSLNLSAIELNSQAVELLKKTVPESNIFHESILNFSTDKTFDLVLIKGVLIHIAPDELPNVYDKLFTCSERYILVAEYYNTKPVALKYRGHENRLYKRDFAGELLDLYPSLELIDYGFCYHRDTKFPQDDITWFLLQKR